MILAWRMARSPKAAASLTLWVSIGSIVVLLGSVIWSGAPISPGKAEAGVSAEPSSSGERIVSGATSVAHRSGSSSPLLDRFAGLSERTTREGSAGLVPNFAFSQVREGSALVPANLAQGPVSPGPTSIGVNDLGLRVNSAGAFVPYSYETTSFEGTMSINNISLLPVMNNASSSITLQLNAVLNNVTIFGKSVYQLWTQNAIFYSVAGDQMQLATDVWNFTAPPAVLYPNDIYQHSPGGFLFTGTYVHAVPSHPPPFIVRPPFTMSLYLNSTNLAGRNALFFNYTLSSAYNITFGDENLGRSIEGGSFDWVIFNSTAGMPAGYHAPPAAFLVSGSRDTGIGEAFDAEMALCGGSDGFTAVIRSLNATAQLEYRNATAERYSAVPAAFTTTEDTGESVEGVDAHYTSASASEGTAYLTNGPEFVYGLWNATAPTIREERYTVAVSPSPTFLWVSPTVGSSAAGFDAGLAAWAISPSPESTVFLPTGVGETYSAAALANDYAPQYVSLAPGALLRISLTYDPAMGLYVPVIAFGNSGVASIAVHGNGSAKNPYVVSYVEVQPISSLFGEFDIFTEPLYPGLLFSGVTAHVLVRNPPAFFISYTPAELQPLIEYWGLSPPSSNDLPIEIYDSSNISIVNARQVSGWFPASLTGFLMASLFLSNDTHVLVAYDTFSCAGSSLVIVNPNGNGSLEHNTVFGDRFLPSPLLGGPNASSFYTVETFNTSYTGGPAAGGLGIYSSGNTVYDNLFETPIAAYSPPQNPYLAYVYINDFGYTDYPAVAATWTNLWNVSLAPASQVTWVNGISLTGSVAGAPFQGGNAWSSWNGTVPYTDEGLIVAGGDSLPVPLAGSPLYAIVFSERGLPPGNLWTVVIGSTSFSSHRSMILVYEPSGAMSFTVLTSDGRTPHPSHGTVTVQDNLRIPIVFT